MRVQLSYSGIGPRVFMTRLGRYLELHYDVQIVKKKPDIYLSAVWGGDPPKGCRRVHRTDGCYFDKLKSGITGMNKRIAGAITKANGVVWQSRYCEKLCRSILGVKPKHYTTIFNGFDQSIYDEVEVMEDKFGYERMFVACAKWRPLKRPKSIIRGFLAADIPGAGLVMMGDMPKSYKVKDKRVKYVGALRSKETYTYYKSADALIHISRLDACPNTVIEALSIGKPIICNNVGGTPEIVKSDGIVLDIDPPLKYKIFKMKKVDHVDPNIIAEGFRKCAATEWNISRPDLDMSRCAEEYYQFFKKLLS